MESSHLDGFLFTSLENMRYPCGLTGSDGALVLALDSSFFLTDSRYWTQSEGEVKGSEIVRWTLNGLFEATNQANVSFGGTWTLAGTIRSVDSTVNLAGTFTIPSSNPFDRTGGDVYLRGTLQNANSTLTLDASTGSWVMSSGGIVGGSEVETAGSKLLPDSNDYNHLDGVTLHGAWIWPRIPALDCAFTMVSTCTGPRAWPTAPALLFDGTQTLPRGTIRFEPGWGYLKIASNNTLTLGPEVLIEGGPGFVGSSYNGSARGLVSQGRIGFFHVLFQCFHPLDSKFRLPSEKIKKTIIFLTPVNKLHTISCKIESC